MEFEGVIVYTWKSMVLVGVMVYPLKSMVYPLKSMVLEGDTLNHENGTIITTISSIL